MRIAYFLIICLNAFSYGRSLQEGDTALALWSAGGAALGLMGLMLHNYRMKLRKG